jgi:hypothetical protein
MLRTEELLIRSPKIVDELMTFVILSNGKEAANYGSHDDCVMALALAAWGFVKHPAQHNFSTFTAAKPVRRSLFQHVTPETRPAHA